MFVLQPNPTFKADVLIPVPGQEKPGKVTFEFIHMGRKALREFFDRLGEPSEEGVEKEDAEQLATLIKGWEGVDKPFNVANLSTLLDNYPSAVRAIIQGYNAALFEGRVKN